MIRTAAYIFTSCMLTICAESLLATSPAFGDLENVVVGGELRIRGNYWINSFNTGSAPTLVRNEIRWTASPILRNRPIGWLLGTGDIVSHFDWNSKGNDYHLVEQQTKLNIRADFTEGVSAFIELDEFSAWGEDFRSNYVTGIDGRAITNDDVSVLQSYIQADNLFGIPLRARLGRQELILGNGWLIGDNSALPEFTGLSFDGLRLTYSADMFDIDAFWTKLRETSPLEEDGDTDFAGIHARYHALENTTFEAYWYWLRDAAAVKDTNDNWISERLEQWFGLDDYTVTNLHTTGLRASGKIEAFDFDAEATYQFGDASQLGSLFKVYNYGDDRASFDIWAGNLEIGYTFNSAMTPRIYLGAAYFGGEDNRDISFWQWINPLAPLTRPQASISFNRLFSNRVYSYFFDEMGELSNAWLARAGISLKPTETIQTGLDAAYFDTVATFDQPIHIWQNGTRIPLMPIFSFWTEKSPSDLGWQLTTWLRYQYSPDLSFETGWSHLFTGDGLKEGNYNDLNGLLFNGGTAKDDADYIYFETRLRF